jgi:hypothetical protein
MSESAEQEGSAFYFQDDPKDPPLEPQITPSNPPPVASEPPPKGDDDELL